MRRSSFLTFLKEKSFIIVLTLMLVSAGTMAALFFTGGKDEAGEEQAADQNILQQTAQNTTETEEENKEIPEEVPETSQRSNRGADLPGRETASKENTDNAVVQAELEDQYLELPELAEASTGAVIAEEFSEMSELSLQWPVEGEVLLEFAMDHSIYFPTLAQYQYNPAMIISAQEGSAVTCAASGTVIDVGKNNEYGHYVTMDLNDGYQIIYGQLFDITTEVGEILETGDPIGKVAYPTRSYTEEGDNLYLKLTKNETAIDPQLYMEKR